MDNFIGKLLAGRYEIDELIGMGGMANVYKAHDSKSNRTVAVKVLKDELLSNEELVRRFENESRVIESLNHPNIVKVYDVIHENASQYIVMEYMDGITLKEYIEKVSVIKWKEAIHFTVQILRALQHAHDKGIVHRDIKPQNIMLLCDGSIKVMDFGIARFTRSQARTVTDKAIGSVHYISPEQARGDPTDDKADIYSVGVMLFEMVTGKLPFEADSPVSVAIKQIQSTPKMPRQLNENIPAGLEQIILKAMQKDPAQRYTSAAEMLRDIELFKHDPTMIFHYTFFMDETPTKNFDRIDTGEEVYYMDEEKQKSPVIPILSGIASAFILVAILFVFGMLWINNPFEVVEDVELPSFIGAEFEATQEKYDGQFVFIVENTEFNEQYGRGVIFDQDPKPGRTVKDGSEIEVKVSRGPKTVTIPDFTGVDNITAMGQLIEAGLLTVETQEFNPAVTENTVIRTEPPAGEVVSAGTTVTIFVSMGEEQKIAVVPDLKGINIEDAKRLLEKQKLRIGSSTPTVDDKPAGTILSQDPLGGTQVPQGTQVNVQVSTGESGINRLKIKVSLPASIDRDVLVRGFVNGDFVEQETLNPSQVGVWEPVFTGEGEGEIVIRVDGKNYMWYGVDFGKGEHWVIRDYSANFTGEPEEEEPKESEKPKETKKPAETEPPADEDNGAESDEVPEEELGRPLRSNTEDE